MVPSRCVLEFVVPGAGHPFEICQCEWLLDACALRAVSKGLALDWASLDDMCRKWLQTNDVMDILHPERCRENFPTVYNTFRASLLQQYALRFLQSSCHCEIAGSYPAARFLKKHHGFVSWLPGDIDVWIDGAVDFQKALDLYANVLASIGVPCAEASCADYVSGDERTSDSDMSPDMELTPSLSDGTTTEPRLMLHSETSETRQRVFSAALEYLIPARLVSDPDQYNEIVKAVGLSAANMKSFGKPRQYVIKRTVIVKVEQNMTRKWYRRLKDLNFIHVTGTDSVSTPVAVHTQFDLSCCSVGMHLSFDLRVSFMFANQSNLHLINGTMTLLPWSFSSSGEPVIAQIRRIMKYYQRGFVLVTEDCS